MGVVEAVKPTGLSRVMWIPQAAPRGDVLDRRQAHPSAACPIPDSAQARAGHEFLYERLRSIVFFVDRRISARAGQLGAHLWVGRRSTFYPVEKSPQNDLIGGLPRSAACRASEGGARCGEDYDVHPMRCSVHQGPPRRLARRQGCCAMGSDSGDLCRAHHRRTAGTSDRHRAGSEDPGTRGSSCAG